MFFTHKLYISFLYTLRNITLYVCTRQSHFWSLLTRIYITICDILFALICVIIKHAFILLSYCVSL